MTCSVYNRGRGTAAGFRRRVTIGARTFQGDREKNIILFAALAWPALAAASPNGGPLGDFEAHADVGSPKIAGYAT